MPYNTSNDIVTSIIQLRERLERLERTSGRAYSLTNQTAAYTASRWEVVLADATGAAFAVTLPIPAQGIAVTVKRINAGANNVSILPNGTEKIDNATSAVLT